MSLKPEGVQAGRPEACAGVGKSAGPGSTRREEIVSVRSWRRGWPTASPGMGTLGTKCLGGAETRCLCGRIETGKRADQEAGERRGDQGVQRHDKWLMLGSRIDLGGAGPERQAGEAADRGQQG